MKRVLLTGSTGFVGRAVLSYLITNDIEVSVALRKNGLSFPPQVICHKVDSIFSKADWMSALQNIDCVIHCAARVHIMNEKTSDSLQAFREVNVEGTLNLAKQAADAGIKRFIFISSIKVNGESTKNRTPFNSMEHPAPEDPYGVSKLEAEIGLLRITKKTGLETVIIRPTLVYGAGVKGNFLNLLKLSNSGFPLPFGAIHNARSMVYLGNLVNLIITCIDHPKATGKIFLASDSDDISLSRLIRLTRQAMGKPVLLVPIPAILFKLLGKLMGKTAVIDRLVNDLQVDSSDAKELLGWQPPFAVEQGIKATVDDFMRRINE